MARIREASLCDTPGKQPPCLHEWIFAGQRTANDLCRELSEVSRERMGRRSLSYPIGYGDLYEKRTDIRRNY